MSLSIQIGGWYERLEVSIPDDWEDSPTTLDWPPVEPLLDTSKLAQESCAAHKDLLPTALEAVAPVGQDLDLHFYRCAAFRAWVIANEGQS